MPSHFEIRTFGCQMNQHDAEKIANLLHHADYRPADADQAPDLILLHTCSVREKAERKLYHELAELMPLKRRNPQLVIGVGGCVAQQEGAKLLDRFKALDFVFGPQHIRHLPEMVEGAKAHLRSLRVDYDDDPQQRFELPERHPEFDAPRPGRAFVTVMEGCDLFCAFCVVPRTRGREVSRSSASILAEVQAAALRGVIEITLLGQTVNAYGRTRPGRARGEIPFAELLRRVAEVPGIERVRFTSPHPMFVTPDLIRAYAEEPRICPHLHLPVQSGSSRVLAAMNRRYDRETYLAIVSEMRKARSGVAITTDLIVGFPGETREDFAQTLSLMSEVGFADSFSYKYSERPGTPIQRRNETPVPAEEAQARLEDVQSLQRQLTLDAHRARVGDTCRVLVDGPSRKGGLQLTGRCPQNRVVNFSASVPPAPGTLAELRIVDCTPHSLLAEAPDTHVSGCLPLL